MINRYEKTGKMKSNKNIIFKSTVVFALVALVGAATVIAQRTGVSRTTLQRHDLSMQGHEVVQVRIDFSPGTAFGKHSHPGEEIIYVLKGLIEYKVEGNPPVMLKAGDVLFIPARTIHSARNAASENASELATYVVEKGKPLISIIK
jgi:quercetin dioxygenase-like cupin family protein